MLTHCRLTAWPLECLYNTKPKKKNRDEKKGNCRTSEVGGRLLAALVPISSSGAGPVAEQCVLKMHVSLLTWAVSFGSVSSI